MSLNPDMTLGRGTDLYPSGKPHRSGSFDSLEIQTSGLIRINGWTSADPADMRVVRLEVNDYRVPLEHAFRTYRPDVAISLGSANVFLGMTLEYLVPDRLTPINNLVLRYEDREMFAIRTAHRLIEPAYGDLFRDDHVRGRNERYPHGPPATTVSIEVGELAQRLPEPLLDFGCGAGVLIRELRAFGKTAVGLELDRPEILASLSDDVRPLVELYDGGVPTRFEDKSFASVSLVEVLEHVSDYGEILREASRLATSTVLITVPDITSIPQCFVHQVVPWHILESTHMNFFTQPSLERTLRRFFSAVDVFKIGPVDVNGTRFYMSLGALCSV